jgi:hypothetical protein
VPAREAVAEGHESDAPDSDSEGQEEEAESPPELPPVKPKSVSDLLGMWGSADTIPTSAAPIKNPYAQQQQQQQQSQERVASDVEVKKDASFLDDFFVPSEEAITLDNNEFDMFGDLTGAGGGSAGGGGGGAQAATTVGDVALVAPDIEDSPYQTADELFEKRFEATARVIAVHIKQAQGFLEKLNTMQVYDIDANTLQETLWTNGRPFLQGIRSMLYLLTRMHVSYSYYCNDLDTDAALSSVSEMWEDCISLLRVSRFVDVPSFRVFDFQNSDVSQVKLIFKSQTAEMARPSKQPPQVAVHSVCICVLLFMVVWAYIFLSHTCAN